ncbi:ankycorbin isoform X1 [Callorhinchus milii]|uniref:ankycorbin isoform X1 n=1 Tax=Callorhinchus milii TaxID=7868 RepID=UPI001C3F9CB9|nr:ankycorbin isoform X1 [Callorhinchus milii]
MVHGGPESPVEILLRVFFIKTSSRRKSSERGRETVREMKRMFCFLATHEWSKNDDRLLQAVEHGDTDKVSSLLGKKGISPTKLDNEGKSALHLAATKGQLECLGAMLAHGVDVMVPDVSGLNVLHLASKNSHQECVKKILQSKCPVECADTNGRTAVHHAASGGSVSIVQLLCEQKCPINTKDVEGFTPLIQAAQSNHAEVCRYLIDQGADIDARDKNGRTALMLACEHGSGNAVEILVKRGADLKVVDALGHDALHYYKLSGNADILSFLQAVPKGHSEDTKSAQTPKQLDPSIRFSGDRSETPKKRKAPPPPVSSMQSPLPTDTSTPQTFNPLPASKCEASEVEKVSAQGKEASNEEMRKLQEEKVKLLEMIQNLNQQLLDKKHLEMEENDLKQQVSWNNGEIPIDMKGTEIGTPERGYVEGLDQIKALQSQIASLTVKNNELLDKLQGLEFHHREENLSILPEHEQSRESPETLSYDQNFNSSDSHRSLLDSYKQLTEMYKEAQAEITSLKTALPSRVWDGSLTLEVCERQNSSEGEAKTGCCLLESPHEAVTESLEKSVQTTIEMAENSYCLQHKLEELQDKYEEAMTEVTRLQTQIQQTFLARKRPNSSTNAGEVVDIRQKEMEELKRKLDEVLEDRERAECMVSDLEEKLEEMEKVLARSISEDEFEEFKQSQSSLLDEVNQEKVLLIEKLREAQGEIKKLQERLSHQGLSQEKQNFLEMQKALNRTIDKLNRQVAELTQWYNEAQSELKEVKGKQLQAVSEHINSSYVPKDQHKQAVRLLNDSIGELKDYLSEAEAKLADAERDTAKLQKDLEVQRQSSVCLAEHTQIVASLENIIKAAESKASQAVQELERKEHDLQILQQVTAENSAIIQEEMIPKSEYEKLKASFRAELNRLTVKTGEVLKEQERASAEITQARKECSLSKSEREVAQAQLVLREQELTDLRAKCREMQDNVSELEKRVGSSLKQEEDKEKKINELYKEVTKLKEALNSLSQLSYTSNIPKRQNQQLETLQQQTKNLQHQLTEANQRHQEVVSVYRMHLLYAVQGQMDEDVQKALKQILTMCKTHTLKK